MFPIAPPIHEATRDLAKPVAPSLSRILSNSGILLSDGKIHAGLIPENMR
ncbi:MAG: hypothetical protein KGL35_20030 [Bradyrhizobium sp.]|nr:hypothetical protein [Bradyrhizobium sp.]